MLGVGRGADEFPEASAIEVTMGGRLPASVRRRTYECAERGGKVTSG